MLKWILENIGVVAVAVVFLVQLLRGVLRAKKASDNRQPQRDDFDADRRTREVQEQIRRQIAERRAARNQSAEPPPLHESIPKPIARPETTQLPELFGGPLGRMLEELQKKVEPRAPVALPHPVEKRHAGEHERQERLEDELKSAEDSRQLAQRRAVHKAADRAAEAQLEPALRVAARDRLLADLNDPQSLRRALVLREVLGAPVGLR